ncbi:MAG: hypothetical protein ACREVL_11235 [Solimonas sp.]
MSIVSLEGEFAAIVDVGPARASRPDADMAADEVCALRAAHTAGDFSEENRK